MDWINLHIPSVLKSPECVGSSPAELGTWLRVLAYACGLECGGTIEGAATWKDRQWQQSCGVTLREVKASGRLLKLVGDDVIINGYPVNKELMVKKNRGSGMAGAMARWKSANGAAIAPANGETMALANAEGEGEGEGERKEKENNNTAHSAPMAGAIPSANGAKKPAKSPRPPKTPESECIARHSFRLKGASAEKRSALKAAIEAVGVEAVDLAMQGVSDTWASALLTRLGIVAEQATPAYGRQETDNEAMSRIADEIAAANPHANEPPKNPKYRTKELRAHWMAQGWPDGPVIPHGSEPPFGDEAHA